MNNLKNIMIPLIALIIFGLFWEWLVWVNGWPNYKMASPSDLWPAFWKFRWLFLSYGWETLWQGQFARKGERKSFWGQKDTRK